MDLTTKQRYCVLSDNHVGSGSLKYPIIDILDCIHLLDDNYGNVYWTDGLNDYTHYERIQMKASLLVWKAK